MTRDYSFRATDRTGDLGGVVVIGISAVIFVVAVVVAVIFAVRLVVSGVDFALDRIAGFLPMIISPRFFSATVFVVGRRQVLEGVDVALMFVDRLLGMCRCKKWKFFNIDIGHGDCLSVSLSVSVCLCLSLAHSLRSPSA